MPSGSSLAATNRAFSTRIRQLSQIAERDQGQRVHAGALGAMTARGWGTRAKDGGSARTVLIDSAARTGLRRDWDGGS